MKTARFLALTFCAALMAASPAGATEPVPEFDYPDVCKNVKGVQPVYETVGAGPYRMDLTTKRPNDCVLVRKFR